MKVQRHGWYLGFIMSLAAGFAATVGWGENGASSQTQEISDMVRVRQANVQKLISVIESTATGKEDVALAMRALGKYRAVEAVPFLVRHLDSMIDREEPTSWKRYPPNVSIVNPAVAALIEIGLPSIDALLEVLATEDSEQRVYLANVTTLRILGQSVRSAYIQERLKSIKDERKAARLRVYIQ